MSSIQERRSDPFRHPHRCRTALETERSSSVLERRVGWHPLSAAAFRPWSCHGSDSDHLYRNPYFYGDRRPDVYIRGLRCYGDDQ